MAILRKNNKDRFTVVSNEAIRDENLSLKALGLLVHLLSLPDDWQFSENGLIQVFKKDGQASIRSGLKELEDSGYLKRERKRDEKGHMASVEWIVYEKPHLEKPSLEDSNLGNRPQLNTKEIKDVMDKELNNTPPTPKGEKDNAKKEANEALCREVVSRFISICKDLPKPMKLTNKRKKAILWLNGDIEQAGGWDFYFHKVSHSDFLCGRNGKWKASFDWLLNPANMTKVLEDTYAYNGNYNAQTRYSKQNRPMPTAADYGDECF